jgi:3-oxoacyl-(acyl-carrier-protein) synthase
MLKKIYITASSCISAQDSFENEKWFENIRQDNNFACIEPDYKNLIDAKLIRRMNRMVKLGVSTSFRCLQKAERKNVDAIITATGYGCIESTYQFLDRMYNQQGLPVNPSAFIQSTHNTVGSQIALLLSCKGYNDTIVDNRLPFELALDDALLYMNEHPKQTVLLGGIDEITPQLTDILFQIANKNELNIGEGSAFFVLSEEPANNSIEIKHVELGMFTDAELHEKIKELQQQFSFRYMLTNNNDLVLPVDVVSYLTLCGSYPANGAFGLWLGTEALQKQISPSTYNAEMIESVLVLNRTKNDFSSIIVIGGNT